MTLAELIQAATTGDVQELECLSLEGSIYMLRAKSEQGTETITDDAGKPLLRRSSTQFKDLLHECPRLPCFLIHQVVHDEMCGHRVDQIDALRIPLFY